MSETEHRMVSDSYPPSPDEAVIIAAQETKEDLESVLENQPGLLDGCAEKILTTITRIEDLSSSYLMATADNDRLRGILNDQRASKEATIELPKHIAFTLEHNDCATVYETVKQIVEEQSDYFGADHWVSKDQMEKAIAENEIWTAHWYPDTPVGFHVMHAADLDVLLAAINEQF